MCTSGSSSSWCAFSSGNALLTGWDDGSAVKVLGVLVETLDSHGCDLLGVESPELCGQASAQP